MKMQNIKDEIFVSKVFLLSFFNLLETSLLQVLLNLTKRVLKQMERKERKASLSHT